MLISDVWGCCNGYVSGHFTDMLINYGNQINGNGIQSINEEYPENVIPVLAQEYVLRHIHTQYKQQLLQLYKEYIEHQ
ncbi:unnamed protein product [Rotaria sp. Silwood1]|nr:unnamed protein product [Rotaria sp. Silwood1]CAF4945185.1 unnamed protein product [Rotaria sp. Silwood1]